jgi:NhaP-type Na+/H+ or K+/H+ antiporter
VRAKKSPKKSPSLISPTGVIKLVTHAMMGAALGLAFTLALTLFNPAVAELLNHGGSQAVLVFVLTLVTTFAIGAMLTGIVFILAEDKQS